MRPRKLPPEDQIRWAARFLRREASKPAPAQARQPRAGGRFPGINRIFDMLDDMGMQAGDTYRRLVLRAIARFLEDLLPKKKGRSPKWPARFAEWEGLTGKQLSAALAKAKVPKNKRDSVKRNLRRYRSTRTK